MRRDQVSKEEEEEVGSPVTGALMAKRVGEEIAKEEEEAHPYAFHVSGPRNLMNLNWRDLINSSWYVFTSILAESSLLLFDLNLIAS